MPALLEKVASQLCRLEGAPSGVVQSQAATCVLDALACAAGGRSLPWAQAASRLATASGGDTPLWASGGQTSSVLDAVFANAVAAHALIHEDMHPASRVHAGTVVVPTALALGRQTGASLQQVLEAVVVGYEAVAQIASLFETREYLRRGLRPSGMFGPFGAAAAAARLLQLDFKQTVNALGLATSVSSGTCEWAYAGSSDLFIQNGFAARGGAAAAMLAAEGVTAPLTVLEGRAGMLAAYGGVIDATPVVDTQHPAILDVYFKAFPACAFVQESLAAAHLLVAQGVTAPDIESIRLDGYKMTKDYPGCDNASSFGGTIERQMSTQFVVAATLVDGRLDPSRFVGPAAPEIVDLAGRIRVHLDEDLEAQYPQYPSSRLVVTQRDGTELTQLAGRCGLSAEQVVAKFASYADGPLAPHQRAGLVEALQAPDQHAMSDLDELLG